MSGKRLGDYELLEEIGRGGMATVYRARQLNLERIVAVKVIQGSLTHNPQELQRFQQEAQMVARLEHPHILPIYDFDGAHDPPFIVMRYLAGGTIKDRLRRGPIERSVLLELLRKAAAGLDYAHRQGVIHRDIKPSNILLDADGNPFISDFGIARWVSGVDATGGALLGTADYVSPEQAMGRDLDHRADLYSFGVLIYQILTGQVPFSADQTLGILIRHVYDAPPAATSVNPALPHAIDSILERALAKVPEQRYGSAAELVEAVETALAGSPIATPERHEDVSSRTQTATQTSVLEYQRPLTVLALGANDLELSLVENLGSPEAARLLRLWLRRAEELCVSRGGLIYERSARGVLAVWGALSLMEDDAEQAVQTALEVARDFDAWLTDDLTDAVEPGRLPTLSVASSRGAAHIDVDGRMLLSGQALGVAARLQTIAPAGSVVIDAETHRRARGRFDFRAITGLEGSGLREAVAAFEVLGRREQAFWLEDRGVPGASARLIGREHELKQLQSEFLEALAGRGARWVTLVGDLGLGKSRLLHEFDTWADVLDVPDFYFFQGRATPQMAQHPYGLIGRMIAERCHLRQSDSAAAARLKLRDGLALIVRPEELDEAVSAIAQVIGLDGEGPPAVNVGAGANVVRDKADAALESVFRGAVAGGAVLVILEDVQWADETSLNLLQRWARMAPRSALLILASARPEFFDERSDWGRDLPLHRRITLGPLSRADSRRLAGELLSRASQLPNHLRDMLVERCEGNPFFLEELITVLLEDGVIVPKEPVWIVRESRLARLRVPATLAEALQVRLEGLPAGARVILARASVVGRVFWDGALQALEAADGIPLPNLDRLLDDLRRRELIFLRPASTFAAWRELSFKNNLLRDVVYSGLLGRQLRAYHREAGDWLMRAAVNRSGEYADVIGGHFELAGDFGRAARQAFRAAQAAFAVNAYKEAEAQLGRAADLLERDDTAPGGLQIQIPLLLGRVAADTGRPDRAREQLAHAGGLAEAAGDEVAALQCEALLARVDAWQGRFKAAEDRLREVLPRARAIGDRPVLILALRLLGNVLADQGAFAVARQMLEESLALAKAADDPESVAAALNSLANVESSESDDAAALRRFEEALPIVRRTGNRFTQCIFLVNSCRARVLIGDYQPALPQAHEALHLADQMENPFLRAQALTALGWVNAFQDDVALARQRLREALRLHLEMGNEPFLLDVFVGLARTAAVDGDLEQAATLIALSNAHPAVDVSVRRLSVEVWRGVLVTPEVLAIGTERARNLEATRLARELLAASPEAEANGADAGTDG
ncbi:MAG: protein kinase [Anaerolineales bacterium]|nr:protein kinase [Anaerolineales bacterium]